LFRTVEPENRRSSRHRSTKADKGLGDPAVRFRDDRNGSIEKRDGLCRRMIVKNRRYQTHRKNNACGDAPSNLEPYREKRDFPAEPFSLPVTAVQIVRKNCNDRAEKKLKHGSPLSFSLQRSPASAAGPRCGRLY